MKKHRDTLYALQLPTVQQGVPTVNSFWSELCRSTSLTQPERQFKQGFRYLLVCLRSENNRFVCGTATVRQIACMYISQQSSLGNSSILCSS